MLYIQTEYVNIRVGWFTEKMIEMHLSSALLFCSALPTYISCSYEQNIKKYVCTESEETAKCLVFLKK